MPCTQDRRQELNVAVSAAVDGVAPVVVVLLALLIVSHARVQQVLSKRFSHRSSYQATRLATYDIFTYQLQQCVPAPIVLIQYVTLKGRC